MLANHVGTMPCAGPWVFVPEGHLHIRGQKTFVLYGDIFYKDPHFEQGPVTEFMLGEWAFGLQRLNSAGRACFPPDKLPGPREWQLIGFYRGVRYLFHQFEAPSSPEPGSEESTLEALEVHFTYLVLSRFYAIHHPLGHAAFGEDEFGVELEYTELDENSPEKDLARQAMMRVVAMTPLDELLAAAFGVTATEERGAHL